MKNIFYKKVKEEDFQVADWVLKWNARVEEKRKHGKFDHLWQGPYKTLAYHGNNTFILQDQDSILVGKGPVNGSFLKHYFT